MIFSQPPSLPYKGLTIILSQPSRFDKHRLLSGAAGDYFDRVLLPFTRYHCDIRLINDQRPFLQETRCVLLLDQEALSLYKPGASLLTYRGSPIISNNIVFIPTLSPQEAFDRKNYENPDNEDDDGEDKESEKDFQKTSRKNFRFWFTQDIKKAVRITQSGIREYPTANFKYADNPNKIVALLKSYKGGYLTIDIETDQHQNITCFSFLFSPTATLDKTHCYEIYVVPFKRYTGTIFYSQLDYCKIFQSLTVAFRDNIVVAHNGSFDFFVLLFKYFVNTPRRVYDTMDSHHRLHPEVEKSLGHCVSLYTDLPYHKDEGIFNPHNDQQETQLWSYNAKDVFTTFLIFCQQQIEAKRLGAEVSIEQSNKTFRSLQSMQYEGCLADVEKLLSIVDENDRKYVQYCRILKLLTGRPINPRSSDQVSDYLFNTLKLPKPAKDPTKEDNLLKLFLKYPYPSFKTILAARGVGKEASFIRKIRFWKDNRLTCAYKHTPDTFRLGSSELLGFKGNKKLGIKRTKGFGTNMQNWNKHIREIVIAPPGYKLLQLDQAGAEALVVAYLCRMGRFRSLFLNKIKPHTFVAMHIAPKRWADRLGLPDINDYLQSPIASLKTLKYWSDLSKLITDSDNEPNPKDRIYYHGKTCCHLLNYDAQFKQFQITALKKSEGELAFSDTEARFYYDLYRNKLFQEIGDWHVETVKNLASNVRVLRNLFGHPRTFNGSWDRETFKQAYAFIPQSTVGVITLLAQTEITERIDAREPLLDGVSLWQNGHDSLLLCVPEEKILEVARGIVHHLGRELVNPKGEKFVMGVGVAIGNNWSPKSVKNQNGMEEVKL